MNDTLGDRMKKYEQCYQHTIPDNSHVIIRIDGRAFHTLTKGMTKPYDIFLVAAMQMTAEHLSRELSNTRVAYTQSDEISLYMCNDGTPETQAWFDNNLQKLASVSASIATEFFNRISNSQFKATFDARAFVLPNLSEVSNYFLWRHKDWKRNSVSMMANSLYSHKELQGINRDKQLEMIKAKNQDWHKLESYLKFGYFLFRSVDNKGMFPCADEFNFEKMNEMVCLSSTFMEEANDE